MPGPASGNDDMIGVFPSGAKNLNRRMVIGHCHTFTTFRKCSSSAVLRVFSGYELKIALII